MYQRSINYRTSLYIKFILLKKRRNLSFKRLHQYYLLSASIFLLKTKLAIANFFIELCVSSTLSSSTICVK